MKFFKLAVISTITLVFLNGCASSMSGAYRVVPGKDMQKIDPKTIDITTDIYRLSPNDVLVIQVEPLEFSNGVHRLEKGNQLHIGFVEESTENYKIAAGDGLTLEFPDEADGLYEVLVNPDGRITLPRIGKSVMAAGMTMAELNQSTTKAYKSLFLTPKLSWSLVRSFNEQLTRLSGNYTVGSDGDIVIPGLNRFYVLGKSAQDVAATLTAQASDKFKNKITANVAVAKVNAREQVDNRLTPSGLLMDTNLGNLPTRISEDGRIYISHFGDMQAQGKTIAELKDEIKTKLQPNYQNPIVVNVYVQEYAEHTVFIGGEVRQPGRYPYSNKLSTLKLIAQAGWTNEFGDLANVLLLRAGKDNDYEIYRTNLDEIIEGKGPGAQDFKISPQDLIIVPPTSVARANRFITQYVRGILPFGTSVSYNINTTPSQSK